MTVLYIERVKHQIHIAIRKDTHSELKSKAVKHYDNFKKNHWQSRWYEDRRCHSEIVLKIAVLKQPEILWEALIRESLLAHFHAYYPNLLKQVSITGVFQENL